MLVLWTWVGGLVLGGGGLCVRGNLYVFSGFAEGGEENE